MKRDEIEQNNKSTSRLITGVDIDMDQTSDE